MWSPLRRRRGRVGRVSRVVVAALLVVPALAATGQAFASTGPVWGRCPRLTEPDQGLRCASLTVPLDYAHPNGRTIQIGISRLPSTDPAHKRGVLLLEPGGQNASELDFPLHLVSLGIPASVRADYDLVSFDPRGIGASTPVTCDVASTQDLNIPPPYYASTAAGVAAQGARMRTLAAQCHDSATAELLPYLTIANVARDMDRIRVALGQQKISYLGYSLGTYVGAVYATLFARHTDRIVLDSVVGPGGMDHTWSARLGLGVQERFPDFASWAAQRNATYGLGATAAAIETRFTELADRLDASPINGLDGAGFRYMNFALLFSDQTFPMLAQYWQSVDAAIAGTGPAGAVTPPPSADFSGLTTLACNSSAWPQGIGPYQADVARARAAWPMYGGAGSGPWPCAYWGAPVEQVAINGLGPSNILMVSNERDPGTPLVGAAQMERALSDRARLVVADHGGHLAYLNIGNACLDGLVTDWLAGGNRPGVDQYCANGAAAGTSTPLAWHHVPELYRD